MAKTATSQLTRNQAEAQPKYDVAYREIQPFGTLKYLPIAL